MAGLVATVINKLSAVSSTIDLWVQISRSKTLQPHHVTSRPTTWFIEQSVTVAYTQTACASRQPTPATPSFLRQSLTIYSSVFSLGFRDKFISVLQRHFHIRRMHNANSTQPLLFDECLTYWNILTYLTYWQFLMTFKHDIFYEGRWQCRVYQTNKMKSRWGRLKRKILLH